MLSAEMYDSEKSRIENLFVKYTAEHRENYDTFLKVLRNLPELRNVPDEDLYSEDFVYGLGEDVEFQKLIETKMFKMQEVIQWKNQF